MKIATALCANDFVVLEVHTKYQAAIEKLQITINEIVAWTNEWKIKLNENKSVSIDFPLRSYEYIPTYLGQNIIPVANTVRYFGMHLDWKLNWSNMSNKSDNISTNP